MIGCAVAALAAATASAQAPSLRIDYGVAPDGGGTLWASLSAPGAAQIDWTSCAGGGPACLPYPSTPNSVPALNAGDSTPGTAFEASATVDGQIVTARSRPYLGRVRWTKPPGIKGAIRANAFVRPVPARWAGGWGAERSYPQLQVCRGQRARRCLTISDAHYWNQCPGTGAVISKRYTGWYLRAIDRRGGQNVPLSAIAYLIPEAIPPAYLGGPASATTPAVRIAPAVGPARRKCGRGKRLTRAQLRGLLDRNAELERARRRQGQ